MKAYKTWMAALALVATAITLSACDTTNATTSSTPELDNSEMTEMLTTLSQELNLSQAATQDLAVAMAKYQGNTREPGLLWRIAADMQSSLTAEQKARLFELAEQRRQRFEDRRQGNNAQGRPGFQRGGQRGQRGARFGQGRGQRNANAPLIELTDEQKEQMQAIRQSYKPQLDSLRASRRAGDLTPADFREQIQALRDAMQAERDAILTAEQKATLDAARAERQTQRDERQATREANRAAAKEVRNEVLNLTDEQIATWDALTESHRTAMTSLREQVQSGALTRDVVRETMQAMRTAQKETLGDLLTDEQYEIVQIHGLLTMRQMSQKGRKGKGPNGRFGRQRGR